MSAEATAQTVVGPYRLEGLLGRGGMGEVFRAYDTHRQRTVALKLLPAALAEDEAYRERFRRESLTAANLSSPHVVPIHDFGEVAGRLFIDMRLITGTDLARVLTTGPLRPQRAASVLAQVAHALEDAHSNGIVHRDVKPSNIVVTDDDFAYLLDFGIAHSTGTAGLTETGTTIGTFGYMAPERLAGAHSDARADVYSLACVLCEMLTGQQPFRHCRSTPALIQAHMNDDPPRPSQLNPGVPPAMDNIVARGMAKNPEQRYPTVSALAEHVGQVARRDEPMASIGNDSFASFAVPHSVLAPRGASTPTRPSAPPTPSRQQRRVPKATMVAVAAVLLVAAGAGGATLLRTPEPGTDAASTTSPSRPQASAPEPSSADAPAGSSAPADGQAMRYTLRITGTARSANASFMLDGSSGTAEVNVPWSRVLDAPAADSHLAQLSAFSPMGDPGSLTCTITDQAGRVVDTKTAQSQGGDGGSAMVSCSGS